MANRPRYGVRTREPGNYGLSSPGSPSVDSAGQSPVTMYSKLPGLSAVPGTDKNKSLPPGQSLNMSYQERSSATLPPHSNLPQSTTRSSSSLPQGGAQRSANLNVDDKVTASKLEQVVLEKAGGPLGLSIIGGNDHSCIPFGTGEQGIYISKITPGGAAAITGRLKMGDRILSVNEINIRSVSHQEAVMALLQPSQTVVLLIQHDPLPSGFQEIRFTKELGEKLGMVIKGGLQGQPGNPSDPLDEGVFCVKINPGGAAFKDGRLKVGQRLIEVNGQSLLGASHQEAVSVLRNAGDNIRMLVCDGFNPNVAENQQNIAIKVSGNRDSMSAETSGYFGGTNDKSESSNSTDNNDSNQTVIFNENVSSVQNECAEPQMETPSIENNIEDLSNCVTTHPENNALLASVENVEMETNNLVIPESDASDKLSVLEMQSVSSRSVTPTSVISVTEASLSVNTSTPIATSYSPIATSHSPIATSHSPIASMHSPIETMHSPIATSHSPVLSLHGATSQSPVPSLRETNSSPPVDPPQAPPRPHEPELEPASTASNNQEEVSESLAPAPEPSHLSMKDRLKLFEKEIEQQHLIPKPKMDRKFSFISDHELAKMKEEETKRIQSMIMADLEAFDSLTSQISIDEQAEKHLLPEQSEQAESTQEGVIDNSYVNSLGDEEKRAVWRKDQLQSSDSDVLQTETILAKMSELVVNQSEVDNADYIQEKDMLGNITTERSGGNTSTEAEQDNKANSNESNIGQNGLFLGESPRSTQC